MSSFSRTRFMLLMAVAALGPLSTDLYLPSLPSISRTFAVGQAETQATLSIFLIGFACSVLICGTLSDRFGRKPVLLFALAGFAAASILCAAAASIEMLWLARLLQALAAGAGPVVTRAIIRDTHPAQESVRMMSYLSAGVGVAPLIGPFIGGMLETYSGWRANFMFLGLYSALSALLLWSYIEETRSPKDHSPITSFLGMFLVYRRLLSDRLYIGFILCGGFAFSGMFSFISGSSFVFISVLKIPPHFFGLCFGMFVLGFMSGAFLGGRLAKRMIPEKVIFLGACISLSAGSILVAAAWLDWGLIGLVLPLYPYMVGMGMLAPSAQGAGIAPHPENAGAAAGLLNFMTILMASITGALLGQIPITSALPMNFFMASAAFLSLMAYMFMIRAR